MRRSEMSSLPQLTTPMSYGRASNCARSSVALVTGASSCLDGDRRRKALASRVGYLGRDPQCPLHCDRTVKAITALRLVSARTRTMCPPLKRLVSRLVCPVPCHQTQPFPEV
jgi:hypothetical protein